MSANKLPAGFEALEPFVARWALDTTEKRLSARCESSLDDIRAFYDVIVDHAEAAIEHIDKHPLNALPPETERLAALVLAMAQAAMAVEIHGVARAPGTPWPNTIKLERGAFPLG